MYTLLKKMVKPSGKRTRRTTKARQVTSDEEEAANSKAYDAYVKKLGKGARAMRASRSVDTSLFHFEDDGAGVGEWTDIGEDFVLHVRRSRSASKQKMLQKWNANSEMVLVWYFKSLEVKGRASTTRVSASFEPA
ncbi:hypothetical protein EDC96DRAFT_550083 [Choanephora cucurbitarum]|nr:hypothetical protein EDC96DRAFT_550083 [Choanephora cucurbitarum]